MFVLEKIKRFGSEQDYGYEVLYRGTDLNRELLFSTISEELDFEIFRRALDWLQVNANGGLYFVNIKPQTLVSRASQIFSLLDKVSFQVVLELREDGLSKEHEKRLREIRKHFVLSLDDFGNMHSNFDRVFLLEPDFIKVDLGLFNGRSRSSFILLVESLRKATSSVLIAERVENKEKHALALSSGIKLGQGYYFT